MVYVNKDTSNIVGIGEDYKIWVGSSLVSNVTAKWNSLLEEVAPYNFRIVRLSSAFADVPNGERSARTLDYNIMDAVLATIAAKGYKAIVCPFMNWSNHNELFGSQWWVDRCLEISAHFKDDPRVFAYELWNEITRETWADNIKSDLDAFRALKNVVKQIRDQGDNKICMMPRDVSSIKQEIPAAEYSSQYARDNILYCVHPWSYKQNKADMLADADYRFGEILKFRDTYNLPIIVGEFGISGSAPKDWTIDYNVKLIRLLVENRIGFLWYQFSTDHGKKDDSSHEVFKAVPYTGPATPEPTPEPEPAPSGLEDRVANNEESIVLLQALAEANKAALDRLREALK